MGPPIPAFMCSAAAGLRLLGRRPLRCLGAEIRSEGELDQLRQQLLDLLRLSHDDALVDDPKDAADDRLLERARQFLAVRGDLAAHAEERYEGLDRALVALDRGGAGGERLDDAGPGQSRLAGDVVREGGKARVDPGRPGVDLAGGVDDATQRLLDRELRGGEEAVLLGGEVLVEGVAGDAGTADDVGDRDGAVTLLHRLLGEGGDYAGPLVLGDELSRQLMPTRWHPRCLRSSIRHERQSTSIRIRFQAGRIYQIPLLFLIPDNPFP